MRKIIAALALAFVALTMTSCKHDSDVVSENLANDADNYKVMRQVVVYNSITDTNVLEVIGWCAMGNNDPSDQVSYTCKVEGGYVKDIIKKSDNVFVFIHQLKPVDVSSNYYKVTVKPTTLIPDFDLQ